MTNQLLLDQAAILDCLLDGRVRGIPGWHEVDWAHVERMRREYPPLTAPHLAVDAVDSPEYNLAAVRRYLGR